MFLYKQLNALPFKISYVGKLMVVAFIGIHIPLISLYLFVLQKSGMENYTQLLLIALFATLAGTAVTLFVIYRLFIPIKNTFKALKEFKESRLLPDLPTNYDDEVGQLMAQTQDSLMSLDELLRYKTRLMSVISHDTKTPITNIGLCCEMIESNLKKENLNKEEVLSYINLIKQSNSSQMNTINTMITIAGFDEKKNEIELNSTNLNILINSIEEEFRLYFEKKKIHFNTKLETTKSNVLLDSNKIKTILRNLIQNAIKFTKEQGTIELVFNELNDGGLVICVKDNGVGIEKNKQAKLFESFFESEPGTKGEKGKGLGLWIVKLFVEMHGGSITTESEPGVGSEFKIIIPNQEELVAV